MILFVINSKPTTSSRPSNPLSVYFPAPQIRPRLTIARVYKLYLLTYLLIVTCVNSDCESKHVFRFAVAF